MATAMKPATMSRRPFVSVAQQQPAKQAVASRTPDVNVRRIVSAGRPALLAVPALLSRASAAFGEELEQASQAAGEAVGEAGRQALSASQVPQWSNVRVPGGLQAPNDVANLFDTSGGSVNPLLLLGAVAAVAVPALLFQALSPGSRAKSTTPANVLKALAEEPRTQLVDIRAAGTVKTQGTPDLSSTKRRLLSLPYTRIVKKDAPEEVVDGFGAKFAKLSALKSDSIVILLDANGKSAAKAAAEVPTDAFDELFYVAGGAAAWEASGQPWKQPGRGGFSLPDFGSLGRGLAQSAGTLKVKGFNPSVGKGGSGGTSVPPATVIAAGGALLGALLLFNGAGTVLEVVGLGAAAQVIAKNFLFAGDRERTTKALKEFVDKKVAVGEVGQDLQKISSALLEGGEEVGDKVSAKVSDKVESASKDVSKQAEKVKNKLSSAAEEVTGKAESAAKKTADKAESATKDTADKAESKTADKAESATKKSANGTSDSVDSAAEEAQAMAEEAKGEAKSWIDSWRSKQK